VDENFSLPPVIDYESVQQKLDELRAYYSNQWLNTSLLNSKQPVTPSDSSVKVSVIVPIYKVEDYLRRCLDSLCAQTLKEIEIICVNDGSPDRSIDILREYEAKDSRVKIIDFPQNQGVAMARNAGLDAATGEYIGFVDPDDAVDANFYETLYDKSKKAGADIAKGARKHINLDGSEIVDSSNELIRQSKAYFSASFWSALYRGSMIRDNHIRFPVGITVGEDLVFQTRCILESQKIVTSDFVYYWYYRREGSAVDAAYKPGAFMNHRQLDSLRSTFSLIIEYANKAFDRGTVDNETYDTLYYNNLCFSIVQIMLTEDVHEKYACTELLVKFYQLCKRRAELDKKLQTEQNSFYEYIKNGDLKQLTRYFVENFTLEDVLRANDVRSIAYFQR
jgi:glycosyltransferase involved in cell wall biosynthesis